MSLPSGNASNPYLDARVTTASQPELQIMLLDGAVRFCRRAMAAWGDPALLIESDRLMLRAIDVVEELVRSVSGDKSEIAQRLEEEYAFAFRSLAAAKVERDAVLLESVIRLLEFQRETWRQALEMAKGAPASAPALQEPAPSPAPAAAAKPFAPKLGGRFGDDFNASSSFTLQV